jgi:hypothetical protein
LSNDELGIRICFGFRNSDFGFRSLFELDLVQHPADVGQTSSALGVLYGALAGAQALGGEDFFENE